MTEAQKSVKGLLGVVGTVRSGKGGEEVEKARFYCMMSVRILGDSRDNEAQCRIGMRYLLNREASKGFWYDGSKAH